MLNNLSGMTSMRRLIIHILGCVFLALLFIGNHAAFAEDKNTALLLTVDGAIGPATDDYIHRGLKEAYKRHAKFVILQIDTPGGLDKSMRAIIKHMLASPIPIITYVAPSGARAASAGTYIVYASQIAAMAPGTNIGSSTPIQMGGVPTPMPTPTGNQPAAKKPPVSAESMKITNDAVAFIRSLAQLHGRNADWAELSVRQAANLPASEAVKIGVVDLIANDIPDLLKQINGRTVNVLDQKITLNTDTITVVSSQPDWRARLLAIITEPNIAYILLLIGIYGLIFEFANPGFVLPGVMGGIALLLGLYALQLLPISYAGLALILMGLAFLAAEAFMPTFGAIGVGGIIAFVAGSILLIDPGASGYQIHWGIIITMAILNALFFLFVIGLAFRSHKRKIVSGREELPGMIGVAKEDIEFEGYIRVHGETWRARTLIPVKKGQQVRVTKVNGLLLHVVPVENQNNK